MPKNDEAAWDPKGPGRRVFALLLETTKYGPVCHGLAVGPVGVPRSRVERTIETALRMARREHPDDWTYDDVRAFLVVRGYEIVDPIVVTE